MSARVFAVVVTYQPGTDTADGLRALEPQADRILVVDNGSGADKLAWLQGFAGKSLEVIATGRNLGVGAAHNVGIEKARALGATHVLLMDQDSVPAPDMVARLLDAEQAMLTNGEKVGAVGPLFHDSRLGKSWPFYRLSRFGVHGYACTGSGVVACDFLISSGTLARLAVLEEVGNMNEGYFLEHVDTEWSLRARQRGYRLFGACAARMGHALGDEAVRVPLTSGSVQLYQPYRHYYLFRNAMLLWGESYTPLAWKLNEAKRLLKRLAFFGLVVPPRLQRLRFMLLGAWHGLRGRSGPLP